MTTIVRREVRKRGFFGWFFLLVFLGFNALMALFLVLYIGGVSSGPVRDAATDPAAKVIAGTLGTGLIMTIWVPGAIITGLLALVFRGSRTESVETIWDGSVDRSKWSRKDQAAYETARSRDRVDPTL